MSDDESNRYDYVDGRNARRAGKSRNSVDVHASLEAKAAFSRGWDDLNGELQVQTAPVNNSFPMCRKDIYRVLSTYITESVIFSDSKMNQRIYLVTDIKCPDNRDMPPRAYFRVENNGKTDITWSLKFAMELLFGREE